MGLDGGDAEERVPLGAMSSDRDDRVGSPRESKRLRKGKGKARGESGSHGSGSGRYTPPREEEESRGQVVFALGDDQDEDDRR
jgi:hypothetical protein